MVRNRRMRWALPLLALVLCAGTLSAQSTREKYEAMQRRQSAFNLGAEENFTYNVNNWLCGDNNRGEICTNTFGSTTGGGGYWPAGTGNQYVFSAGLQWAARDPLDPTKFAAAFCFNVGAGNAACRGLSPVYHSDSPEDLANWPDACYLYNPQTGERVQALSQLDTCTRYWDGDPSSTVPGGHPLGIEVTQHSLAFTLTGFRDMLFFIFKLKNVSNTPQFRQANPSAPPEGWTIKDLYVAFGTDHDVSFTQSGENFGTFVPFLRNDANGNPIPMFLGTIWQSDFVTTDFTPYPQCGFCSNPGFVGSTFLRSPYNTTGDTIRTNTAGVVRVIPPISREELEPLRLAAAKGDTVAARELTKYEIGQSFASLTTNGAPFPDPSNAAQAWRYYSGNLNPQEASQVAGSPPGFGYVNQPSPNDTRLFHATGPITLAPGDSADIIVALVAAAPVFVSGVTFAQGNDIPHGLPGDTARIIEKLMGRGVEGTAYPSLFKAVLDARQLFATNFLLPSPPPAPTVTVIPGNHENTVVWSDEAVNSTDPYAPIAAERGIPGFREKDFEGYRVWRKVRPNAPWELIAQFDLKNGIGPVVTPVDTVINQEGQVVVVRADTAAFCGTKTSETTEKVSCAVDTGLQFTLVDRGGTFPHPEQGPGLTNGVTYYYAVTAFDINSPFAPGGSSLQSGQRLSAAPQAVGGAAGTPRSNASNLALAGFTAAMVGGGKTLDPNAPMPTIDPAKGTFSGPMPPTDLFTAQLAAFVPRLAPEGTVSVTIDSIKLEVKDEAYQTCSGNGLGVCFGTYYTVDGGPGHVTKGVQYLPLPVWESFGEPATLESEIARGSISSDPQNASLFNLDPNKVGMTLTATAGFHQAIESSVMEGQRGRRGLIQGYAPGGSRWFSGDNETVANPTVGARSGQLPGVAVIDKPVHDISNVLSPELPVRDRGTTQYLYYFGGPLARAADVQFTWQADGKVEVQDLTHNVPVLFKPDAQAAYGFFNECDGDGILTWYDAFCIPGIAEFWGEFDPQPMVDHAVLQPVAVGNAAKGGTGSATAPTGMGFGLWIDGEPYVFQMEGNSLPAPGTKWTLRTYFGTVKADTVRTADGLDVRNYTFEPAPRSATVPGLRYEVTFTGKTQIAGEADVKNVHTVPDPFIVSDAFQTNTASRHIQFVNLPDKATIRIYSLSGVLVTALQHDDPTGGGTENWDLRNRNHQFVASGVYFYHVSTPDGKSKVGKFTIIQAPSQTSVPTTN